MEGAWRLEGEKEGDELHFLKPPRVKWDESLRRQLLGLYWTVIQRHPTRYPHAGLLTQPWFEMDKHIGRGACQEISKMLMYCDLPLLVSPEAVRGEIGRLAAKHNTFLDAGAARNNAASSRRRW